MKVKNFNNQEVVSVSLSQEEQMEKDYKLEQLDHQYGSLFEEVLSEVFLVEGEDESFDCFDGNSIYNLMTDEEIEIQKERELRRLDGESASLDDLETLEKQAKAYFKNPRKVFIPKEEVVKERVVTGFIQVSAGIKFDRNGNPKDIWKSYGQKLVVSLERLYDPGSIHDQVKSLGFELSDMVRVVFYGEPLKEIVGTRVYRKGEKKTLEALDVTQPCILLAVPCADSDVSDDSLFNFVDSRIKENIQTGGDNGLDRMLIGHWEMTWSRLEELKLEEKENVELEKIQKVQANFAKKRRSYLENFKEATSIINKLNSQDISVKELAGIDTKVLNQMIYLCKKGDCRIENPAIYFQVDALSKRKSILESGALADKGSVAIIQKINAGEHVDIHLLSFEELEGIFELLWNSTGIRISSEYKAIYFKLKERYQHLKRIDKKIAA